MIPLRLSWDSLRQQPSRVVVVLLVPLMLLEGFGLAAEGSKRYGTFEGGIMLMAAALVFIWNVIGGTVMFVVRNRVRRLVAKSPLNRGTTFVLFATGLALLEEAITTGLTNLAPLLGHPNAFITASRNYFEVVVWHSVIVIGPMFVVWAWFLSKYQFSAGAAFLLFGVNGVVAELLLGGPALAMAPIWVFVYGLMIFLPAYSFPAAPGAKMPRWYHYPAAVVGCLAVSAMMASVIMFLSPRLPHFGATLTPP